MKMKKIITLLIVTLSVNVFSQSLKNNYDFDEKKYDNNTPKELGFKVLKSFENYNETEYFKEFVINKEVLKYIMYDVMIRHDKNLEDVNFDEKIDELHNSQMFKHKTRVNSIIEKIKTQNVNLSECKIDSSSSEMEKLQYDVLKGSVTIYLSDEKDSYRFKITGLNRIKGKWFIVEPQLYWHNKSEIEFINQLD